MNLIKRSIITTGVLKGAPVLSPYNAPSSENMCTGIDTVDALLETSYYPELPLYLNNDALFYFLIKDIEKIRKVRKVLAYLSSSQFDKLPFAVDWVTVYAINFDFYDIRVKEGDELIVDIHSPHLLIDLKNSTDFKHYYILTDDEASELETKEFILSTKNNGWKLTKKDFTEIISRLEFERMMQCQDKNA